MQMLVEFAGETTPPVSGKDPLDPLADMYIVL